MSDESDDISAGLRSLAVAAVTQEVITQASSETTASGPKSGNPKDPEPVVLVPQDEEKWSALEDIVLDTTEVQNEMVEIMMETVMVSELSMFAGCLIGP